MDFLSGIYGISASLGADVQPEKTITVTRLHRSKSTSTLVTPDKVSLGIKDDVFVANLMASINPEPWELRKRMRTPKPVNHMKRRIRKRLESNVSENTSNAGGDDSARNRKSAEVTNRDYARNN